MNIATEEHVNNLIEAIRQGAEFEDLVYIGSVTLYDTEETEGVINIAIWWHDKATNEVVLGSGCHATSLEDAEDFINTLEFMEADPMRTALSFHLGTVHSALMVTEGMPVLRELTPSDWRTAH